MVKSLACNTRNLTHQFLVVGRALPTEKNKNPKIWKMRVFAEDSVHAKSRFWYFLRKSRKIKKATGEIIAVHEIYEKDPSKVKTFGIVCTYKSKFGYHTLYKEFRSTTINGAVDQLYSEMAGRHKAQRESIVVVRTTEIKAKKGEILEKIVRRANIKQLVRDNVKFPILQRRLRPFRNSLRTTFKANRPNMFS